MQLSISRSETCRDSRSLRFGLREPLSFAEAAFVWLGAYAGLWLFTFWSLVLRARLRTGEWPTPARGPFQSSTIDPKEFPAHHTALYVGLVLLAFVVLVAIVLLLTSLFVPSQRPRRRLCAALLTLTALLGTSLFSDFMLWLFD